MNFKDVKFYDEKTKALTLVTEITDIEKQKVETKTYHYPFFVKGIFTKKAIDLGTELEENEYIVHAELFDKLANFFVELYGNQFTVEELVDGISQNQIINTFMVMLFGVLQGDPKKE